MVLPNENILQIIESKLRETTLTYRGNQITGHLNMCLDFITLSLEHMYYCNIVHSRRDMGRERKKKGEILYIVAGRGREREESKQERRERKKKYCI